MRLTIFIDFDEYPDQERFVIMKNSNKISLSHQATDKLQGLFKLTFIYPSVILQICWNYWFHWKIVSVQGKIHNVIK